MENSSIQIKEPGSLEVQGNGFSFILVVIPGAVILDLVFVKPGQKGKKNKIPCFC